MRHVRRIDDQFRGQVRDGRKFMHFAFETGGRPSAGDTICLVDGGGRPVLTDAPVTGVRPMTISRSALIGDRIASVDLAGEILSRGLVEFYAILEGFGPNDGNGASARARWGAWLDFAQPGTGMLTGALVIWLPPGGAARVKQVTAAAFKAATFTELKLALVARGQA